MSLPFGVTSPDDWGLPVASALSDKPLDTLDVSPAELDHRARAATYEWLLKQFDDTTGAFHGHYRVPDGYLEPPQTVNLIANLSSNSCAASQANCSATKAIFPKS